MHPFRSPADQHDQPGLSRRMPHSAFIPPMTIKKYSEPTVLKLRQLATESTKPSPLSLAPIVDFDSDDTINLPQPLIDCLGHIDQICTDSIREMLSEVYGYAVTEQQVTTLLVLASDQELISKANDIGLEIDISPTGEAWSFHRGFALRFWAGLWAAWIVGERLPRAKLRTFAQLVHKVDDRRSRSS